ncbi:hypothetical protein S40293_11186 [Stachybotrys chartarum IBT 40293]|nr:hypothetical protein S40293_11186 [Stachybotrys chartarum IBT 40293]
MASWLQRARTSSDEPFHSGYSYRDLPSSSSRAGSTTSSPSYSRIRQRVYARRNKLSAPRAHSRQPKREASSVFDLPSCSICPDIFETNRHCVEHEILDHRICVEHNRTFYTSTAALMIQHLHSPSHQGYSSTCPFCRRDFLSASGMVNHLESRKCPRARRMNREALHSFVRLIDVGASITKDVVA